MHLSCAGLVLEETIEEEPHHRWIEPIAMVLQHEWSLRQDLLAYL
jgi:hypothetical protein